MCMTVTVDPAYGAHKKEWGQSVHGEARIAKIRFGLRDLGVCGGVPGRAAGESQRSRNARSRVKAAGCTVTPHAGTS